MPVPASPSRADRPIRKASPAFTMIEIMMVLGIAAMILAIGIPSFARVIQRDPLHQAVADVLEACSRARAQSIMNGTPAEIRFRPPQLSFETTVVNPPQASGEANPLLEPAADKPKPETTPAFSGRWSEEITLEMLDVNFQEYKDEEEARVRFFPNGTCDEFTIVVAWQGKYRKITLDIITGLADLQDLR